MSQELNRRIPKLMTINLKMEYTPEHVKKFANDSILLDSWLSELSDKEAINRIISKEDPEKTSAGIMYHILTSADDRNKFERMVKLILGAGVEFWHMVLCNMNMIIMEMWHLIHHQCKEQVINLAGRAIRNSVRSIENVLINVFRSFNGAGEWQSKCTLMRSVINILKENEVWFNNIKSSALIVIVISTVSHFIVDTPAPLTHGDTFRQHLIHFLVNTIKHRRSECITLGRDFILILARLGRLPQFEEIWRDFKQNPTLYGVSSVEEMLGKPNHLSPHRLSTDLQRKIDHIVFNGGNVIHIYFDWLKRYFRYNDSGSLRAEIVRYLCLLYLDSKQQFVNENRIVLLYYLIITAPAGAEQQWLKCCLFLEWFGCDERYTNVAISNVEVALFLIRYSLSIQTPMQTGNSVVHCSSSQFANALLEYLCKSVDLFSPSLGEHIRRNVNTAMKSCRDKYPMVVSQVLENFKIDRRVNEMMRGVWPDFMRQPPGSAPPMKKRKAVESPKQEQKRVEIVVQNGPELDAGPSTEELKKMQKEKSEASYLEYSQKLTGDLKNKLDNLKAQYKDLTDDADKCEAIENVLNCLFKVADKIEESQMKHAAHCLQIIIGSVCQNDKPILPEKVNEKELEQELTHPVYAMLRMFCFPPADEESASEVMALLLASMRESDKSITLVFLYFIKGTVTRPEECVRCYKEIARVSNMDVQDMLAQDMQLCSINDNRLFVYLLPFIFTQFQEEVLSSSKLVAVLCNCVDGTQLHTFISNIIREDIKLFRKETFTSVVMASVEWPTSSQWIFWSLVQADGVAIEWMIPVIPRLESDKHSEAISSVLLMLKNMDREPWPGLIRSLFQRIPQKEDTFTIDALKVLIDDSDQCQRVAELVGALIKKQISNNELMGIGVKAGKKGLIKLTLQQILEHLSQFSDACIQKKQRTTEQFLSKHYMQDAFATIKSCDKILAKKYHNLFGVMDILAADAQDSPRTLRGNRQAASSVSPLEKQGKRKQNDNEGHVKPTRRKLDTQVIQLDDSDSD